MDRSENIRRCKISIPDHSTTRSQSKHTFPPWLEKPPTRRIMLAGNPKAAQQVKKGCKFSTRALEVVMIVHNLPTLGKMLDGKIRDD